MQNPCLQELDRRPALWIPLQFAPMKNQTDLANTVLQPGFTQILSVSALNRLARNVLESALPLMWVGGEISNLTRASSGHVYFTLKDANAQVRCTMWRNRAQLLAFRPENGMRVEARALVSLYEARGDYQLNVEALRPAGIGNLFEAFNRLKEKLAAEGLFDAELRRPIPRFPRGIAIVTSPAAAALRDVLATLRRRSAHLRVTLFPAPVQGPDAPQGLIQALRHAGQRAQGDETDLVLLVRGGGSIEDLWAFNDEALARAIRHCPLPVISGVGHETDFTIADFVADLRAATPTGAAELASAGFHAAQGDQVVLGQRLHRAIVRRLENLAQRVDRCALRLIHPRQQLRLSAAKLDTLSQQLKRGMRYTLVRTQQQRDHLALRLSNQRPRLSPLRQRVATLDARLKRSIQAQLQTQRQHVSALGTHLEHLDPTAVLARGYSITRDRDGRVIRSVQQVAAGDALSIELSDGHLDGVVRSSPG